MMDHFRKNVFCNDLRFSFVNSKSDYLRYPWHSNITAGSFFLQRNYSGRKKKHTKFKFVDKTRVTLIGGKGGNGCISFETPIPAKKVPSGGHGGQGGNVVIEACSNVQSLNFSRLIFKALDGKNGAGNRKHGKRGENKVVKVPLGTIVREIKSGSDEDFDWKTRETMDLAESESDSEEEQEVVFCCDLEKEGETFIGAEGGPPGLGNQIHKGKSRFHSTMQHRTLGQEGESRVYELELKTLADIGLVGFPNAGKSTLLGAISRAKPQVGAYPFTTLRPFVGHVEYSDSIVLTVADIPGLIEGAHEGRGLGLAFLRHIERTKALAYVIDTAGSDERNPDEDFAALQKELFEYSPDILDKPSMVLANKIDLEDSLFGIDLLRNSVPASMQLFPVSGMSGKGIKDAVIHMRHLVNSAEKNRKF
mmetsp:Transcript_31332/g.40162  ORF Transcript_31332/g.40162 Transcript_31332/m.40162 type:complete len:420 (-) Transcript_31332:218-1477(-)|eukprot:CAMPEP_0117754226 /NCGR_PEP_ID=MMETSP0947-20121206/12706_1 /TAXON_ID=44440 /ORGANISM="Chattonella subsalsa, Strain CCMP2191" /LENGTH=419 /DNA_ID=CAMNT_0005573281 /DNA_START=167 /DNA_END=1426 /DNA_ORIENTATION=+